MNLTMGRVATTYGEQRIRIFIFPDGKHLPKNIYKHVFTQGIYLEHSENFEVLKLKGCTWVVVEYCTFGFCSKFWGGVYSGTKLAYSLHYICSCN